MSCTPKFLLIPGVGCPPSYATDSETIYKFHTDGRLRIPAPLDTVKVVIRPMAGVAVDGTPHNPVDAAERFLFTGAALNLPQDTKWFAPKSNELNLCAGFYGVWFVAADTRMTMVKMLVEDAFAAGGIRVVIEPPNTP